MKLQITNLDGIVFEEKEISLTNEDTLVMVFDQNEIDLEVAGLLFNNVAEGINNNAKVIAIPKSVEFQVIKKL